MGQMFYHLEGSLASSVTPEVSVTRTSFRRRLRTIQRCWHGSKAWRWRRTCTSSPPIRRSSEGNIGYALEVWLRWYVKSPLLKAGAGSYGQLAWSSLLDVPFPLSCTSTWEPLKSLNILSLPLVDFIAPADCSSWELRLRQSTALGGTDVAVAPGGGRHIAFFSHVDLPFYSLRPLGHWRLWARLLNFYPSPLESPMDVNSCLRHRFSQCGLLPAGLPLLLAASTSTTCLYDLLLRLASTACLYGLPLRSAFMACLYGLPLRSAYVFIVIVIVHPLFKWNVYLSLYVILYVFLLSWNYFSFFSSFNCAVEGCDILVLLIQPLPCFAYPCLFYFC